MLLNISKAKLHEGTYQDVFAEVGLPHGLNFENRCMPVGNIVVRGKMVFQNNALLLDCKCSVKLDMVCDRCGKNFSKQFVFDLNETFVENEGDLSPDQYEINGISVDLEKPVFDNLLLSIPSVVLCKKNCKGLCSVCGKNKNDFSCNCEKIAEEEQKQEQNPFEKLK